MEGTNEPQLGAIKSYLNSKRFAGIIRPYTAEDVFKLRGSLRITYTLAEEGAKKLWDLCQAELFVGALGAVSGHQAAQMVQGGLKSIYCSGWQVAGDYNEAAETYPDQSLYPANSVPRLVQRINNALVRKDQIYHMNGRDDIDWLVPIVADGEAGFGGILNVFELTKHLIQSGAAGVHFEDQLASEKKCGHMGGKVVIPTSEFIKKLNAARLAADILGVPTVLIARTDANSAKLLASDIDGRDVPFIVGKRNSSGFFRFKGGTDAAIARALAYAPYADMLWCETSNPNLEDARKFAEAVHAEFPGKPLAYNCSPSFNWKKYLNDGMIAEFQKELGKLGYKFQFVTLAGFHALNFSMYELAWNYARFGMSAFVDLQQREFKLESNGYTAIKHQEEVGTGYFDAVQTVIAGDETDTVALKDSTENKQF